MHGDLDATIAAMEAQLSELDGKRKTVARQLAELCLQQAQTTRIARSAASSPKVVFRPAATGGLGFPGGLSPNDGSVIGALANSPKAHKMTRKASAA